MQIILSEEQLAWLESGERGLSSNTIFTILTGIPKAVIMGSWDFYPPSDPSDFRRCELLLVAVPEFRKRFDEMKKVSKYWELLVEHWQELCKLMDLEAGNWREKYSRWQATRTYNRMKELEKEAKGGV